MLSSAPLLSTPTPTDRGGYENMGGYWVPGVVHGDKTAED